MPIVEFHGQNISGLLWPRKEVARGPAPANWTKGSCIPGCGCSSWKFSLPSTPARAAGAAARPVPFPRKAVHVTLTEDELKALDDLARLLSDSFDSRLHRGHVISFLVFYLSSRLQNGNGLQMPAGINTLTDLAHYLDLSKL